MDHSDSHDDPIVVYRASAILMAAFALALLVVPFDWIVGGAKSGEFVTAAVARFGEWGTRLLFAVPCGLLAAWAGRMGWGHEI
jgi:hypothetical protein